jgi:4-oxalocrotonate tautomerase
MPSVHVYIWPGRSREEKKRIACGMTRVLSELSIPAEAVEVLIHEIPTENWAKGGELACDWAPKRP